jgi:hypothetical protein
MWNSRASRQAAGAGRVVGSDPSPGARRLGGRYSFTAPVIDET